MSGGEKAHSGLTRRGFLKSTALVAGVVGTTAGCTALAAAADAPGQTKEEEQHLCICTGNCGGGCALRVHVKDGKAFYIDPWPYPDETLTQACQRGLSQLERVYSPKRLTYPMRRAEGTERGAGEWERISWDEAISEIATKWKGYQAEFGDASVVFSGASGNGRDEMSFISGYPFRLACYMGAGQLDPGYDNNLNYSIPETFGFGLCFQGNDWRDLKNAKNILIWGANVTEAQGVKWRWLAEAIEGGAHTVVIDPNYMPIASKCDEYLPIRPGTDALLAFGMMRVCLEEGLVDEESLRRNTVAPYLVKESDGMYLRANEVNIASESRGVDNAAATAWAATGTSDNPDEFAPVVVMSPEGKLAVEGAIDDPVVEGSFDIDGIKVTTAYSLLVDRINEYDMDTITRHTGISGEKIRELALMYADGPSTVFIGYGPDHYSNGVCFYLTVSALCMITGNILEHGTGITGDSVGLMQASGNDNSAIGLPPDAKGVKRLFSMNFPKLMETGMNGEEPLEVKSLYIWCHNPLGNQAGRQEWLKAFEKVDFIVVADVQMSDTTRYADIVLPVPHYFELESYMGSNTYMCINEAAVEPAGECMGDFEIINMLGRAMGFEKEFSMTREEYNTAAFENDLARSLGVSWEALKRDKTIKAFPGEEPYVHGSNGFATTSGRAQFYFEGIRPTPDFNQPEWDQKRESLPYWIPPVEAWYENPEMEKFPFQLMNERDKYKVHSQFNYNPTLLEISPEPVVKINPDDAAAKGIKTGDYVKVFNDRGYVVVRAAVNAGNHPGIIMIDHGWHDDQFVEGHYNDLPSTVSGMRYTAPSYYDTIVDIEKWD